MCLFRNQTEEAHMEHYIGLDVSQAKTAICIVDGRGKVIIEGKSLTQPDCIYDWLIGIHIPLVSIVKVGLEAGAMSAWLCTELAKKGLPIVCLEAWQAHEFLKAQRNKTDRNDAKGLAQLVRMGGEFLREVSIKGYVSQEIRTFLTLRQQLVQQKVGLENNLTGCLKPFGLIVKRKTDSAKVFRQRVLEALTKADELGLKQLREAMMPSLDLHKELCLQLDILSRKVEAAANAHPVCRRLMTIPGVGPVISLSFVTAVDDPRRFVKDEDIGAYFGLTPKQFQSGETDHKDGISKLGNMMTRQHLVQAATVMLTSSKEWSTLKSWGMNISKKRGFFKARIAVARKLAIIMHRMWINDEDFRFSTKAGGQKLAA
jgi:transposase